MDKLIPIAIIILILGGWSALFNFFKKPAESPKIYKVGIIIRGESYRPGVEGFKSKMRELGYEEGKNIIYRTNFVEKREDLKPVISRELQEGIDLMHTYSTPATVEAHKLTSETPIVFGSMGDPLASGVVESLQRPGKNVTGVSSLSSPLAAKRLEFLKEAVPSIKKVAIPFSPDDIPGTSSFNTAMEAAQKLGLELVAYHISKDRDVKKTALAIKKKDVDAIVISSDSAVWATLSTYVEQAKKEKLPFAVFDKDMVEKGGLLGYGPDYFISGEQSAVYADKIFRGANPALLPIDAPRKLLLVLNARTARQIGITFPSSLLRKADLIINGSQ